MKTLEETIAIIDKNLSSKKISNALKSIKSELELFSNLPDESITLQAYCVKYNFTSHPICVECNANKLKFISFELGFSDFCSYKCKKKFDENNGILIKKDLLIKKLEEIYKKVEGPMYEKFVFENKLLYSLKSYTSFLPEDCKVTERIYCVMENINEIQICKQCGINETKYKNFVIGYTEFCSTKCSSNSESKKSQISETNIVKYGHENAFRSNIGNELISEFYSDKERIQKAVEKGTATKIANHGEDVFKKIAIKASNTKSSTIINGESMHNFSARKGMETKLLKYGRSRMANPEVFYENKRKNFILNRTEELKKKGIECNFSLDDYKGTNIEYQWKCTSCNSFFEKAITGQEPLPICPICNKKEYTISKGEDSLANFIITLNIDIESRDRKVIAPKEIDILIPSKKIGIEYNGLYYHSFELQSRKNITKQEVINYHLLKTNLAKKEGVDLIHVFEHEWILKEEIVRSILKNKLGVTETKIGARNCYIQEVSAEIADEFLEENHIQGKDFSKIRIGLFLKKDINGLQKDTMVSLMTFKKPRYNHEAQYEIKRFCSLLDTNIQGAGSKLLKYFEETYSPNSILTYADKRFSFNSVYTALGFEYKGDSNPNYFYFKGINVFSREYFMKHKIKEFYEKGYLISSFDENLTEYENMRENGFKKIYDCGNKIFIKKY